jgi:hypothetical protein
MLLVCVSSVALRLKDRLTHLKSAILPLQVTGALQYQGWIGCSVPAHRQPEVPEVEYLPILSQVGFILCYTGPRDPTETLAEIQVHT